MSVKEKLGLLGATILTAGLGVATPAQAQQAPQATAGEGESIVVTGSRIRRESFDSPNPTVQVGSKELDDHQIANTVDAIEDIPLIGVGSNNRGTQSQNGDSFAFPDILDLGTQRTLTLLNGRRIVPTNQGTVFVPGNASGAQVDLSTINPQIIDRTEVVVGTGGAIYGADAVGGVVNIITKDNYEGLDLRAEGGQFETGEGRHYRVSGLWGTNFAHDKGNVTISLDYFNQDLIHSSTSTPTLYQGNVTTNVLNGGRRNSAALGATAGATALSGSGCATAAACTALIGTAFLGSGADGVPTTFLAPLALPFPYISQGGTLVTGVGPFTGGLASTTQIVPGGLVNTTLARSGIVTSADPNGFASFAPTALTASQAATPAPILSSFGLTAGQIAGMSLVQQQALALQLLQANRPTPYEYLAAHPSTDPLLFWGTFGVGGSNANRSNGYFPTTLNTGPDAALFPFRAVVLAFGAGGTLTGYNPGNLVPPNQALVNLGMGGQGYDPFALGYSQVQAGTERATFSLFGHYDVTDWLRYRSEILYTKNSFSQISPPSTNQPAGNAQAGTLATPIYIDQNPYLGAANVGTLNGLCQTGLQVNCTGTAATTGGYVFPTIGGQRVVYMSRALDDLWGGGTPSTLDSTTWRVAQVLEGDFNLMDRHFYWDASAIYGESEDFNRRTDVGDIEYALATDVVTGPGGQPVCRQQTLGAPQSIAVRDPSKAAVLNALGLTPTADQVARCVPLNLFGSGAETAAARNYVIVDSTTHNLNRQIDYSATLSGELLRLPAGALSTSVNYEWRREHAEFEPNQGLCNGNGRTALQCRGSGEVTFKEYGYEVLLPIFGDGFQFPGMHSLEFNYAFRIVERNQSSQTALSNGTGTKDDTFNYSFRWNPVEELSVHGARSRTVRSASLVELLGPFTIAFTTPATGFTPCTTANIGPTSGNRYKNCVHAVEVLGVDPDGPGGPLGPIGNSTANDAAAAAFLATYTDDVGGTRSAVAAGNPNLRNEEANSYTYGVQYQPKFIPHLTLAADFFSVDISHVIGLNGPFANGGSNGAFMGTCFDGDPASNFHTNIGGINACDQFLYGVETGVNTGIYRVPGAINPLTGDASFSGVLGGTPAFSNSPFNVTLAQFNNLNAGSQSVRGVNFEARYNFALGDVPFLGSFMDRWGDMFLRASVFQTQRYDLYANDDYTGLFDRQTGEHPGTGQPEYKTRMDFRHRVGNFDQTLEWFWNSASVTNILTAKELYPEQSLTFQMKDVNFFNYFASYNLTDSMTLRLTVNNVTDTLTSRGKYGVANAFDGGLGREWIVGIQARF